MKNTLTASISLKSSARSAKGKVINEDLPNVTYNKFMPMGTRIVAFNMVERFPEGNPITMILSNAPSDLEQELKDVISKYCKH